MGPPVVYQKYGLRTAIERWHCPRPGARADRVGRF